MTVTFKPNVENLFTAEVLGALIKQGLVDSDEIVITSALECFIRLIKETFKNFPNIWKFFDGLIFENVIR